MVQRVGANLVFALNGNRKTKNGDSAGANLVFTLNRNRKMMND